ncbi:MAG: hypothetical protein HYX67_06675, partial [Candidatus Melainabacteria bacterium]|nr:hypothetical protein [Candidatus Melainabacteria bacterium]
MSTKLIEEINVLTLSECAKARLSIHELKPLWDEDRLRLGAGISYYKPPVLYYATAKRMNPVLQKHFGWLYEKLLDAFKAKYDCPVTFRSDLALPGFNIYCGPSDFSAISYNVHVDLQYLDLNWDPEGSADFDTTMSFTLPVAAPQKGTGVNIWDVRQLHDQEMRRRDALSADKAVYQAYSVGTATIHDGKHY